MPLYEAKKWITIEDCRAAPNEYFIFGDNVARWGKGGQAQIRDEPNAIGIPTKFSPYEYFSEDADKIVPAKIAVQKSIIKVKGLLDAGHIVWFPMDGVGTGLAKLQEKAPQIQELIHEEIEWLYDRY